MKGTSRIAAGLVVLCLSIGVATAQSLAELSKKEKERRAKLKGRATEVVTNEDLKYLTKREAVSVRPAGGPPLEEVLPPPETAGETGEESPSPAPDVADHPFAKTILTSTALVADAGAALGGPDGSGALIAYGGYLDLAIDVRNGDGPDIAVYAQRPEEGILPETMLFFVFVPDKDGEWSNIGTGTGTGGREDFDLVEFKSANRVRILFWEIALYDGVKPQRAYPGEYAMGVDAVEALNR